MAAASRGAAPCREPDMITRGLRAAAVVLGLTVSTVAVSADDWIAERLRGAVFTFVDGGWVQLHRGDVVPDRQVVRTQNNGRITLVRGAEIVEVSPNSQIEIVDKDGQQFTTVNQWYGTVAIEAEVRNVQHFAVVNQHLAAVVKGTRFTVKSNDDGASVDVTRGVVSVQDSLTHDSVQVPAGHSVETTAAAPLVMDGGSSVPFVATSNSAPSANTDGSVTASTSSQDNNGNGGDSNGNQGGDNNGNHGDGNNGNHGDGNNGNHGDGNNGNGNGNGGSDNSGPGNGGGNDSSGHGNGNGGDNSGHGNGNDNSGHGNGHDH